MPRREQLTLVCPGQRSILRNHRSESFNPPPEKPRKPHLPQFILVSSRVCFPGSARRPATEYEDRMLGAQFDDGRRPVWRIVATANRMSTCQKDSRRHLGGRPSLLARPADLPHTPPSHTCHSPDSASFPTRRSSRLILLAPSQLSTRDGSPETPPSVPTCDLLPNWVRHGWAILPRQEAAHCASFPES
jgi:hypothetical protein